MIYTKKGDQGMTSLVGGTRVEKCDPRVEAYGTVDELDSVLGVVAQLLPPSQPYQEQVRQIQHNLFVIQALLAAETQDVASRLTPLDADAIVALERWIDVMESSLPPLRSFVTPGGSLASAVCHVARTVCRRAERRVVSLTHTATVDPSILRYLNRLSDYLFDVARILLVDKTA